MKFVAFERTQQGTGASRRLRNTGKVPGIVYGGGEPRTIEVDHNALFHALKREAFHSSILEMELAGQTQKVLLRDFQMHPWKQEVLHVDFQRVDPNKKIHMRVPLHFLNAEISPGVKSGGGVVTHALNDLEIVCLPDNLPEYVEVDLKDAELNDIIHVNDLKLPQGVEPTAKLKVDNPTVASVHVPKVITVEEEVAAPVTEITGQAPEGEAAAAAEGEKKEASKEPAPKEAGKDEKK